MRGLIRGATSAVVMLLLATVLSVLRTVPAGAAPAYPPSQCPTVSVDRTRVDPGATIVVTGVGFPAGSSVELRLDPSSVNIELGSTRVGADGTFSVTITFPDVSAGPHFIFAIDGERLSCPADPSARVFAVGAGNATGGGSSPASPTAAAVAVGTNGSGAGAGTPGVLSSTGVDIAVGLVMGLALIAAGILLLRGGRRRRRPWSLRRAQRAHA